MIAYPDTSLLMALFINEPGTVLAQTWLLEHLDGQIAVSGWTEAEVMSAAGNRARRGDLTPAEHRRVLGKWQDLSASFDRIQVDEVALVDAAHWLSQPDLGLKAGDALHLAIAKHTEATLWTFDKRLSRAGQALGLAVETP